MPNRLATEPSPYLLQHKDNPVDWYPWTDEAFARARREDKPIFLSIGYSTCHWCHVMEHESFENARVAEVLNRLFVSIKVDREERPDVDRVYMTFIQATTGSGGWPMSVWLTPSLQPFYGGTYFPPESRWGRPGFVEILEEIGRAWREERSQVEASAASIVERLRTLRSPGGGVPAGDLAKVGRVPEPEALARAGREFASAFDARRGGFGNAPKFPRPSELLFLLREHARTGEAVPRDMVLLTLRAMALGGMRDHLGGGFHRYSVDGDWRVPHFEKMLYDQAQLALAYLEAAQLTGEPFYADVARDTLAYVRRDLSDPAGGFYSAEDADSVPPEAAREPDPHKMEGAFYVWRDEEVGDALGADADVFRARYGVLPDGNAPFDPHNEFVGKNLLYTARSIEDVAARTRRTGGEVLEALGRARTALLAARAQRHRPHLDDKVLTAWNGLMIAAFARAARVLGQGVPDQGILDQGFLADARRAATFIRDRLWRRDSQTLLRRYRAGDAGVAGYAEDYAYLVFGLLELFQADGDPDWLDWAITLQRRMDELFWDPEGGGWFSTTGDDADVLLRLKEDSDGAEPSASSVGVLNLLVLSHLTGDAAMVAKIERTLGGFGARAADMGRAVPMLLAALSTYHAGMPQIVIVEGDDPATFDLLAAVPRARYLPTALTVPVRTVHRPGVERLLPWVAATTARAAMETDRATGRATARSTAYVCRAFACQTPVTSPEELARQLDALGTQ